MRPAIATGGMILTALLLGPSHYAAADDAQTPPIVISGKDALQLSGIYPHLAHFNDQGECGTGAVQELFCKALSRDAAARFSVHARKV